MNQQSRFMLSVSSFIWAIKMFLWNIVSMRLTCLIYISRIEFVARMSVTKNLMAVYLDVGGIRIVSMKLLFFKNKVWIAISCPRFLPKDYNFFCNVQLKLYHIYMYIYIYLSCIYYIYIYIYIYIIYSNLLVHTWSEITEGRIVYVINNPYLSA